MNVEVVVKQRNSFTAEHCSWGLGFKLAPADKVPPSYLSVNLNLDSTSVHISELLIPDNDISDTPQGNNITGCRKDFTE